MSIRVLIAALAVWAATPLTAQQHPLVGHWQVAFAVGMRMENGTATPLEATGSLDIESKGDSLIATLATDPSPDVPARPPARWAALAQPGEVAFVSRVTATVNMNGEERRVPSVNTWKLTATGDALTGTVERRLEGGDAPNHPPSPVTGTRRKG